MEYRNIFGRLEYKKGAFSVEKKTDVNAKYYITKTEAWYKTSAAMFPFFDVPVFDSFIKAARFLHDNYEDLI